MNSGIYIIENLINHKMYIGSSCNIIKRFRDHKSMLRRNEHHTSYLQHAFNKYGEENFDFRILIDCPVKQLLFWEKKMFETYRCCEREFGYNLRPDPTTGEHSEETRKKMSEAHTGKKVSLESRKKMSEARTGYKNHMFGKTSENSPNFGKQFSIEHRKKISEAQIGEKNHNFGKTGKNNPNFGQKRSVEICKKISEARTGQPWSKARRLAFENKKNNKV